MERAATLSRLPVCGAVVLCGVLAACPYLVALTSPPGSMILLYLAQLPLFVAGLWLGVSASIVAGLTASLILVTASNPIVAAAFAGLNAAPVALLVRQSLLARTDLTGATEWYPPGLLTAWLTGLGLAMIAAALLLFAGPDGMQATLREVLAPALSRHVGESIPERGELLNVFVFILPGIVVTSWMVMTATNGCLAQGLLAHFGANWRPSPDLAALGLPTWILWLLAFAVAATAFSGTARFLGVNAIIILAMPFCLAGFAVLHTLARRLPRPTILLVTFYVLAGVFGWPLLFVVILGLLDSSLGLRRRFAQP